MPPALSFIVLRSSSPELLKQFYECIGLVFKEEQHGTGPVHWAADIGGGTVLEIYRGSVAGARIGFTVDNLTATIEPLRANRYKLVREAHETPFGLTATAEDPDWSHVELTQR